MVFSQGQTILDDRNAYIWHPDLYAGKPFLLPAEDVTISMKKGAKPNVAIRVEDYAPYFKETIN